MRNAHPVVFNLESAPSASQQALLQLALLFKKIKMPFFLEQLIYTFLKTPSLNKNKTIRELLPFVSHFKVNRYSLKHRSTYNTSTPENSKQPQELPLRHSTQNNIALAELHNSLFYGLPHKHKAKYCFVDLKYNKETKNFIAQRHSENVLMLAHKQSKRDTGLLASLCYFKVEGYKKKTLILFNALSCYPYQSNLSELLEIASYKAPMIAFIRSNELSSSTLIQLKELLNHTRLAGLVMIGKLSQPQLIGLQQILAQLESNYVTPLQTDYTTARHKIAQDRHSRSHNKSPNTESKKGRCSIQ